MELEIKGLFQNKAIKIKDNSVIIDIDEILIWDINLYESLLKEPIKFFNLVKEEVKVFGLDDPYIKILNWKEERDISNIRVEDLKKPLKLDGMVSKLTDSMALVISKSYECISCGCIIKTPGKEPIRNCSCGGKRFNEVNIELQDIRELVLEELQEKTKGKQPQKIRVRLTGKLTDEKNSEIIKPGNRISIIGVIDKIKINSKLEEEIYQYRIFTLGVSSLEEMFDDNLNEEDVDEIHQIAADNPLEKLSSSLAPNIWGREELKKILVLQMVNGVKKELSDGKFTRNWISILVVGSPSTSKSDLGTNVILRTPKSFYASGDNSSGAGLTVSAVKDEILGNWAAEIGSIVKASGSTAVIDELDKFPKDQLKALHTPMELGFVKFNKAGMDVIFPSETSVLAMANPKFGIFEDSKPLVEQINLPPALLSRFDIIYTLKDVINKKLDDQIVEIIYSQDKKGHVDIIPVALFRKYITYARKFEPKLQIEHLKDLQEFYHDIRKKSISVGSNMKGMPIGVRHLQGIIRLAEASAKIRLSELVETEDIDLAKNLFYDSLVKIGMDEGGVMDLARISPGKTIGKRKYMEILLEIIRSIGQKTIKEIELKKVAEERDFPMNRFYEILEELNKEGFILKHNNFWILV